MYRIKEFATSTGDRERLEQIAAPKFIGLPLRQIKAMLDTRSSNAGDALLRQRRILEEQRQRLDRAINAIDWELYEEERATRSAGIARPPDRFDDARVSLYRDIAAAVHDGVDVSSERARSLIARWRAILDDERAAQPQEICRDALSIGTRAVGERRGLSGERAGGRGERSPTSGL